MTNIVFAFDRDFTVDSSPDPGPIPLRLVKKLATRTEVWAIGNQRLKHEAGIPGLDELWSKLGEKIPPVATETGESASEIKTSEIKRRRNIASKHARLMGLLRLYPDAGLRICVDDYNIGIDGWNYYDPDEFMVLARAFGYGE